MGVICIKYAYVSILLLRSKQFICVVFIRRLFDTTSTRKYVKYISCDYTIAKSMRVTILKLREVAVSLQNVHLQTIVHLYDTRVILLLDTNVHRYTVVRATLGNN